ncbi:MAG: WGR domain-containing protein [Kofleriaceae bacterium]
MKRFEYSEGSSNKFWEIGVTGVVVTTRWGRIGSDGSSKQQTCASAAAANAARDKLIAEKTRKGYQEVGGGRGKTIAAKVATKAATKAATKGASKAAPAAPSSTGPAAAPGRFGSGKIAPGELTITALRGASGRVGRLAMIGRTLLSVGEQCFASSDGKAVHRRTSPGTCYVLEAIDGAFYAAGHGIAVTSDAGATWKHFKAPTSGYLLALYRASDGTWWLGDGQGVVYWSARPDRGWKAAPFSLKGKVLSFRELDGKLVAIGAGGGGAWDGKKFRAFKGFQKIDVLTQITETPSGALVVIGDGGIAYRSVDRGATWKPVRTGTKYDLEACAWVAGALIVVGGGGTVLISVDEGKKFKELESDAWDTQWTICSWGDGAIFGGADGSLFRLASSKDPFWRGATDEFAPPPPTVDRDLVPRAATPAAEREKQHARLLREAVAASDAASAKQRAARPADAEPKLARMVEEEAGDDTGAIEVYADWLQGQGDPRGELAAIQLKLAGAPKDKPLRAAEKALFKTHRDRLLGKLAPFQDLAKLTWRAGFIDAARVANSYEQYDDDDDDDEQEKKIEKLVETLLDEPSARFLRALTVGIVTFSDNDYGGIAKLIGKRYLPALRSLFLGDFDPEETEVSWSSLGNLEPVYAAVPNLRRLKLRSGDMKLGSIVLPHLERFDIETGGLDPKSARAIAGARWPSLRELSIQVGTERYGGTAQLKDLQPILDGVGLPRLRHLGLTNLEYTDAVIAPLAGSKILPQLESLDLSLGVMAEDGARALYRYQNAFAHLKQIDLGENYLDRDAQKLLKSTKLAVHFGRQRDDEGNPENRYVSVGE